MLVTGVARIAAPDFSAARKTRSIHSWTSSGRAASCTATNSASGRTCARRIAHRIGPFGPAGRQFDVHERQVGGELLFEVFDVVGGQHDDRLHDVVAIGEMFGRAQPDGPPLQFHKRLLAFLKTESGAFPRSRKNDCKFRHDGAMITRATASGKPSIE